MLSYKLGPSQKTQGWLLPGLLWENGEQLVHPFPFLALPRHVRDEPSQKKKSDLQWLFGRLRVEQCGNYGWQEGRCVVERRGPARRNHPVPEALKEPQRNWKKNKQVGKAKAFFFFYLLLWHLHDIDIFTSVVIVGSFWLRKVSWIKPKSAHPVSKWPGPLPYMMNLRGCGPISNTSYSPTPSIMASNNLHLSPLLVFLCLATCFSLSDMLLVSLHIS